MVVVWGRVNLKNAAVSMFLAFKQCEPLEERSSSTSSVRASCRRYHVRPFFFVLNRFVCKLQIKNVIFLGHGFNLLVFICKLQIWSFLTS